jgi:hypothetical protein
MLPQEYKYIYTSKPIEGKEIMLSKILDKIM